VILIQLSTWVGGVELDTEASNPFDASYIQRLLLATFDKDGRGRPFQVSFIKRTDGTVRHMKAILVPREERKEGEGIRKGYNYEEKKLLPVIDLEKKEWRTIPLDGVFSFQFSIPLPKDF
jgi:WYL domain-containing protein